MRIFLAGLRKLVGRPASFVSVGLLVGLLGLILIAAATVGQDSGGRGGDNARALITFPGAYDLVLSFMFGLGGLVAVIYGAAIAGSEWGWGTLKNAVARGESRTRYMLPTFAAIVVMLAVGLRSRSRSGSPSRCRGVDRRALDDGPHRRRHPEPPAGDGRARLVRGVEQAALGFAIATLARSQLAGIGAGIAFYFGETFAAIFLPTSSSTCRSRLPRLDRHRAVAAVAAGGGGGGLVQALEPDVALALVGVWLVGALLVTVLFTERAEITG